MKHKNGFIFAISLFLLIAILSQCTRPGKNEADALASTKSDGGHKSTIEQGRQIFRFDTFGDEDFWSGLLHIDKAIAGAANGGFGTGVSPATVASYNDVTTNIIAKNAEALNSMKR